MAKWAVSPGPVRSTALLAPPRHGPYCSWTGPARPYPSTAGTALSEHGWHGNRGAMAAPGAEKEVARRCRARRRRRPRLRLRPLGEETEAGRGAERGDRGGGGSRARRNRRNAERDCASSRRGSVLIRPNWAEQCPGRAGPARPNRTAYRAWVNTPAHGTTRLAPGPNRAGHGLSGHD